MRDQGKRTRYAVDAGDGVEVHVCVQGEMTPEVRDAVAALGRAAAARFCDHYIEVEGDPWAGTYCKLPAGHPGPHLAHYYVESDQQQRSSDA